MERVRLYLSVISVLFLLAGCATYRPSPTGVVLGTATGVAVGTATGNPAAGAGAAGAGYFFGWLLDLFTGDAERQRLAAEQERRERLEKGISTCRNRVVVSHGETIIDRRVCDDVSERPGTLAEPPYLDDVPVVRYRPSTVTRYPYGRSEGAPEGVPPPPAPRMSPLPQSLPAPLPRQFQQAVMAPDLPASGLVVSNMSAHDVLLEVDGRGVHQLPAGGQIQLPYVGGTVILRAAAAGRTWERAFILGARTDRIILDGNGFRRL
ncbi:MAG: hypothetical protein AAB844_00800 [Patescibacteria group bacterium]